MDIHEHLILIRNKDKTKDIRFCKYKQGKWHVTFHSSPKTYAYNYNNVLWIQDPIEINIKHCSVYAGAKQISGIKTLLKFDTYYRLIYKSGFSHIYHHSDIKIEKSSLTDKNSEHVFNYLSEIAYHTGQIENGNTNFLSHEYQKLTHISPRCILSNYLSRQTPDTYKDPQQLIFPFGLNQSQKKATERAFTNQLSIIEGPPGTGKTQTILNIIANAIMNDKTVAVVSNSNSATLNVIEKLEEHGLDFFAAYLGNSNNQKIFIENQTGILPNMDGWKLERTKEKELSNQLITSQKQLEQMLILLNRLAKLKEQLSALKTENTHFKEDYLNEFNINNDKIPSFYKLNAIRIMQFLVQYQELKKKGKFTFRNKIHFLIRYGIYNFNFYHQDPETIIAFLQKKYYETKQFELNKKIAKIEEKLSNYDFDQEIKLQNDISMKLFKSHLAKKYKKNSRSRPIFTSNDLWKNFDSFVKQYPVILSTTHSLRNPGGRHHLFDYILVDEASLIDIVSGALALSSAENAVIVGDLMQLPHVVPNNIKKQTDLIYNTRKVHEGYHYSKHSLLSSIHSIFPETARTLLKEHYRCHPKIIEYCNQKYYNGELVVLTKEKGIENPLILYETVEGNHARKRINERQVDVIYKEIIPNEKINPSEQTVGIIAPYRDQVNLLTERKISSEIEIDTVHKYQGQERNIIILSTVNNDVNKNDFVDQPHLVNVAVSRAIDQLIVVTAANSETWQDTNIGDLVRYIKYNNFQVIKSDIRSIFDLLYKEYSEQLIKILKENKIVSLYTSENLMNIIISKVLQEPRFSHLSYVLHQPLRMLLRDTSKLTQDERKYALNILTHIDFVIYNKVDKMPILVVEVDGYAYHAENPIQSERDQKINTILEKYNIPYIRMKTTGSEEEKKLRDKLMEILD